MATRALITGAGGLIGSALLRCWDLEGVVPVPVRSADTDLLVPGAATALVEQVRPDLVVHLAWCASGDAGYRTSPDNDRWVTAGVELRDACRAAGARLWATGTVVDTDTDPQDAYTASKAALRRLLAADVEAGEIGWLRPSYVFDEVSRRPALLAHALAAHDRGESAELRTPGSVHDFVHVTDVAGAVLAAVSADCRGEVAIGSGRVRSVAALVEALGVAWHPSPTAPATGSSQAGTAADISRLTDVGWTPRRTEELFGHE